MKQTIIGFDSAWTDKAPGGICALTLDDGEIISFTGPQLASFEDAVELISQAKERSDYVLIALDQPTVVPNAFGIRPVERVAGSVVNGRGGAVQPSNTSKTPMFGASAPIWKFLDAVDARENPLAARNAVDGVFLIEVFPALALPSFIPSIWQRQRAAKYNPAAKSFLHSDWEFVTSEMSDLALKEGLSPVSDALNNLKLIARPRKGDQDKLDALISLMIAYTWRFGDSRRSMVIGDEIEGYMVTPVSQDIRCHLTAAALRLQVPYDRDFEQNAKRLPPDPSTALQTTSTVEQARRIAPLITVLGLGQRQCPECGHTFSGIGWGGIDAHWKAQHIDIMDYDLAWPLIRKGLKPSENLPFQRD